MNLRRLLNTGAPTLLLCVAFSAVLALTTPEFATRENLFNVWLAALPLFIVATGQTVVLISAGIDLSVTSIIAMASVTASLIATNDQGMLAGSFLAVPMALIAAITVGCLIGVFNGFCVAWLKMPAFIVTMTSMMAVSGLAIWWTQSKSIYNLPASFLMFGRNVGMATVVTIGLGLAVHWLLSHSLFGLRLRSLGDNPQAAHVSGVPVEWTIFGAYLICGVCAAIASVLITGQLETGSPVQWENNLLDVIGATVIGGTSLYGGRGNVMWTLSGVILLVLIDNSLNLVNCSHFTIMMAKGVIILLAALLDAWRRRVAGDSAV